MILQGLIGRARRANNLIVSWLIVLGLGWPALAQGGGPGLDVTPPPLRGTWRIAEAILAPIGKFTMAEVGYLEGLRITIGPDTIDFFGRARCDITEVHTTTYLRGRDEESSFVDKWGPVYPGLQRRYTGTTFACSGGKPVGDLTFFDGTTGEFAWVERRALYYHFDTVIYRFVRE